MTFHTKLLLVQYDCILGSMKFIKTYDGIRYLVLFSNSLYAKIYDIL